MHHRAIRNYANTCKIGVEIATLKKKTPTRRSEAHNQKPVALTLKVDHGTYVRLCTFGATERKTNQDILKQALQEYLDRAGA